MVEHNGFGVNDNAALTVSPDFPIQYMTIQAGLSAALITPTADPDQPYGACLMVATAFSSSCFGQAGFWSRRQA
jgi:hypothetical protein